MKIKYLRLILLALFIFPWISQLLYPNEWIGEVIIFDAIVFVAWSAIEIDRLVKRK